MRHPSLLLALIVVSSPLAAVAEEPVRTFGASVGLSAGVLALSGPAGAGSVVNLSPLDLELEVPFSRTLSVQLWVPLLQLLAVNTDEGSGFLWTNLFLKISPGGGDGFFVSPGLGFMLATIDGAGAIGPELSVRLGYEASSRNRGFGFTIGFRPWTDLLFATRGSGSGTGVGASLELGFHFYGT